MKTSTTHMATLPRFDEESLIPKNFQQKTEEANIQLNNLLNEQALLDTPSTINTKLTSCLEQQSSLRSSQIINEELTPLVQELEKIKPCSYEDITKLRDELHEAKLSVNFDEIISSFKTEQEIKKNELINKIAIIEHELKTIEIDDIELEDLENDEKWISTPCLAKQVLDYSLIQSKDYYDRLIKYAEESKLSQKVTAHTVEDLENKISSMEQDSKRKEEIEDKIFRLQQEMRKSIEVEDKIISLEEELVSPHEIEDRIFEIHEKLKIELLNKRSDAERKVAEMKSYCNEITTKKPTILSKVKKVFSFNKKSSKQKITSEMFRDAIKKAEQHESNVTGVCKKVKEVTLDLLKALSFRHHNNDHYKPCSLEVVELAGYQKEPHEILVN